MKMSMILNLVAENSAINTPREDVQNSPQSKENIYQTPQRKEIKDKTSPGSAFSIPVDDVKSPGPVEEVKVRSTKSDDNFLPPIHDENRGIAALGFKSLMSNNANQ